MANGGQGARDGGRTRGALMRRAALIAYTDLNDAPRAIALLGDALIAHVDPTTLDALEELARDLGDLRQAEATLTRALAEVFEGALVRQLLARRAKLRRLQLDDKAGAAADLKKLYELSPSDQAVLDELSTLLTELNDHRAMVQVYEDQILRGKDVGSRIDLARKVAQLWEVELDDPREAADAWRRVLRMRQGDPEATAGLERAKTNMLHRASDAPPEADADGKDAAGLAEAVEKARDVADGDNVVIADDLAESVDDVDDDPTRETSAEPTPGSKRNLPPPLPRG
jgi:tetratricopeptide (TPR) repeat protein